jgi:hypothetical protein
MPSHLRNGKDLSFKQLRAAEREAEKRGQQQRASGIAARDSYVKPLSPSNNLGTYNHPVGVSDPTGNVYTASSFGQSRAVDYLSSSGDQQPAGYTFSPAALERLRRSREQHAHGAGGD